MLFNHPSILIYSIFTELSDLLFIYQCPNFLLSLSIIILLQNIYIYSFASYILSLSVPFSLPLPLSLSLALSYSIYLLSISSHCLVSQSKISCISLRLFTLHFRTEDKIYLSIYVSLNRSYDLSFIISSNWSSNLSSIYLSVISYLYFQSICLII